MGTLENLRLLGDLSRAFRLSFVLVVVFLTVAGCQRGVERHRASGGVGSFPDVVLWVWDRPSEGTPVDSRFGYAPLLGTVEIGSGPVRSIIRRNPLKLPPKLFKIAVVRIEIEPEAGFEGRCQELASAVLSLLPSDLRTRSEGGAPSFAGLQIDFDAPLSARHLYRCLLTDLRKELAPGTRLLITALSSWCFEKAWLEDLDVDLITPMLFGLSLNDRKLAGQLLERGAFPYDVCNRSLGVSLSDPPLFMPRKGPVFVFDPGGWTDDRTTVLEQLADRLRSTGE